MLYNPTDIPSASAINYHDADEVCGYQLLLCKIYELEGGLDYPPVSSRLTTAIKREGRVWLTEVRRAVAELFASPIAVRNTGIRLGDIPRISEAYDFFYRVCNGTVCKDFIRETALKSTNRYVKGDKSISQAQVALMLLKEMERDARTMEDRYLTFGVQVMKSWVADLERTGKIGHVSAGDAYDILNYLLLHDLFAFGIKRDNKLRWIKSYALTDERLSTLDTNTLLRYAGFNQAAEIITGRTPEDKDVRYVSLYSAIAGRRDINPYLKEGLDIDLSKYQTA